MPASEESLGATEPADATPMTEPTSGVNPVPESLDRQEIARLAFSYWEARGRQGGSPDEDWLRAEQELRNRSEAVAKA